VRVELRRNGTGRRCKKLSWTRSRSSHCPQLQACHPRQQRCRSCIRARGCYCSPQKCRQSYHFGSSSNCRWLGRGASAITVCVARRIREAIKFMSGEPERSSTELGPADEWFHRTVEGHLIGGGIDFVARLEEESATTAPRPPHACIPDKCKEMRSVLCVNQIVAVLMCHIDRVSSVGHPEQKRGTHRNLARIGDPVSTI
jgi:hypothetical protein